MTAAERRSSVIVSGLVDGLLKVSNIIIIISILCLYSLKKQLTATATTANARFVVVD